MQKIRGLMVPEGLSPEELKIMMESGDMKTFSTACEALCLAKAPWAYEILKQHISHKDLYKRRYVLSVIFHYPQAAELVSHLEQALNSEKPFLYDTALNVIIQEDVRVSDDALLACFERNHGSLNRYVCLALETVEKNESNTRRILKLYRACRDKSFRIGLAETLYCFCREENHMEFFHLFRDDPAPHIRILACRIAKDYHHAELLAKFAKDWDGHIRKLARFE